MSSETPKHVEEATQALRTIIRDSQSPSTRLALALLANPRGVPTEEYDADHGIHSTRLDISLLNTPPYLGRTPFRILRKTTADISGETRKVIALTLRETDEQIILTPPHTPKNRREILDQIIPQAALVDALRRRLKDEYSKFEALLAENDRLNKEKSEAPQPPEE